MWNKRREPHLDDYYGNGGFYFIAVIFLLIVLGRLVLGLF